MIMNKKLNRVIVDTIIRHIPDYQNPIESMMDILDLSKDSIYRRINGKIPFTVEELVKLSNLLNFSLDTIVKEENANDIIITNEQEQFSPVDFFIDKLQSYYYIKKKFAEDIDSFHSIVSLSKLYILTIVKYDLLFKFYFYKWLYQMDNQSIHFSFSDLKIPKKITELQKKLNSVAYLNNRSTYITDPNILTRTVNDIQYFFKRELITNEELKALKEELFEMICYVESNVRNGFNENNSLYNVFVSTVDIDSSIIYMEHKETKLTINWYNSACPTFEYNLNEVLEYKKWIESLKKFSTLISKSNFEHTAIFLKKQMIAVESIDKIN